MPTLRKTKSIETVSISTDDKPIESLLTREWLLTNGRGGYASSTVVGCNTRRYHGLLIGSLNPPVNRIAALATCLEMIIFNGEVFNLSTFEFSDKFAPAGFGCIKRFRQDTGVHFDYQTDRFKLTKSVYLLRDTDTVVLLYDFTDVKEPAEFVLRPFVGLRDFHALQKSYAPLRANPVNPELYSERKSKSETPQTKYKPSNALLIRHDTPGSCELLLGCDCGSFEKDEQWWFDFVYRNDREREQDFTEDLWTPGFFKCRIDTPAKIVFRASLSPAPIDIGIASNWRSGDIEMVCEDLQRHRNIVIAAAKTRDEKFRRLCLAADQFIAKRSNGKTVKQLNLEISNCPAVRPSRRRTIILAGFPWFADWGRDTFVALPGLLLSTGRFDEAKSVLTTFSQAADKGMIPNRFDDYGNTAHFNSIDASLWFINAAFQYLDTSEDCDTFTQQLLPTIRCIIDSYRKGSRFGIYADIDGLITGGDSETQLTWMDAKYDGIAFTPRYGKAVEINALWYNNLCCLAEFYSSGDTEAAEHYRSMADEVEVGFRQFWNEKTGYLNDCILPDIGVDTSLRPNQIFAVSLPFSPLSRQQQKSVVDVVQKNLLTPYGLRTLAAGDSHYRGTYTGTQRQRDEAYHQGTVWPYLIGPFVESYLRVNDFSRESKEQAAEFIEPLMRHLTEDGGLGQVCEIFDGDAPHRPKGCIAQAWSVAELIRVYQLLH